MSGLPRGSGRWRAALASYAFPGNVRELENILERAMTLCEGNRITSEDLGLPEPGEEAQEAGVGGVGGRSHAIGGTRRHARRPP